MPNNDSYYGFNPANIADNLKSLASGAAEMGKDVIAPPGATEADRLRYLGDKYIAAPLEQEQAKANATTGAESLGHRAASYLPVVGPWAAGIGGQIGRKDFGGAAVQALPAIAGEALRMGGSGEAPAPAPSVAQHVPAITVDDVMQHINGPNRYPNLKDMGGPIPGGRGEFIRNQVATVPDRIKSSFYRDISNQIGNPKADYVYHATDASRLPSIQEEGLRPGSWYARSPEEAVRSGVTPISGNVNDIKVLAVPRNRIAPASADAADMGAREIEKGKYLRSATPAIPSHEVQVSDLKSALERARQHGR